jgi:hypothetical protein
MKTMQTPTNDTPQITQVDLIKVRVMNKKYFESILDRVGTQSEPPDYNGIQFLAYVTGRDAILGKNLNTGHLVGIRAINYYSFIINSGNDLDNDRKLSYAFIHSLPQLFLD